MTNWPTALADLRAHHEARCYVFRYKAGELKFISPSRLQLLKIGRGKKPNRFQHAPKFVSFKKLNVSISLTKFLLLPDVANIHLPIQVQESPGENQFIAIKTVYSTLEPT